MSWQVEKFHHFTLYAVTDVQPADTTILKKIEAAAKGGADIIQLRSKSLNDNEFLRIGQKAKMICHRHHCLFFVNDRADLAVLLQADGLHVGQDDIGVKQARQLLRKKVLFLGKSTHSALQALKTAQEDVDYIGVGPVFQTPTKPTYQPVGLKLVRLASQKIRKPFVAIGGINLTNLSCVIDAGASRVAVVRALFNSNNILKTTQIFKQTLLEQTRKRG
jgi:thiamine-phosphate pyrophosphorylase